MSIKSDLPNKGPLSGIRVIDATHMLAGPYSTWLLAMLGADVIKVERPQGGDYTRGVAPFKDEESIYFNSVNRNKRSVALNLKEEEGKAVLRQLLSTADVFVENNRAGAMERLGFGYEAVSELNPRLVYAAISGFGQDGPYKHLPSFDVVAQAMSGMMSITGEEFGPPARVGISLGDIGSGLFTTVGVLAALVGRGQDGKGSFIDISMLDCQLAMMENAIARFLQVGDLPRRLGSRHALIAPFQAFATADEPIAICVDTEEQWQRMCIAMQRPEWIDDPLLVDGPARALNHGHLEPLMMARLHAEGREYWMTTLQAADVPCSPINTVAEAIADPQVQHRGMIVEVPPQSGNRYVKHPLHMPFTEMVEEQPSPGLGEHSVSVLQELGYSDEQIGAFKVRGVI
ncbi:CaiB/BaiF CoA-transferase family protein [Pseudomonas sp. SZMC_28357]|uniref:CaiB/BaiF CoA transferase family protein n=1 Tax=Pseudomonas sp. SZMC_28357 TaxID=3074380 RepID=UPI002871726A|nr:CaiB/BaiF CoA-transferase family protein [Pseudomonas sp. SZMC_28357]MDR9753735.1 CaiB/BaiF CoA-transferase family protein [Pseudomonas sp. SZMC_28357]